jgi:hypothetical protein
VDDSTREFLLSWLEALHAHVAHSLRSAS